jgi:hypothetical protein
LAKQDAARSLSDAPTSSVHSVAITTTAVDVVSKRMFVFSISVTL